EGRVRLDWSGADGCLRLGWSESGGPPVGGPPHTHGFGSRLIAEMPRMRLGAEVEIDYRRTGLAWRLICPAAGALA
ncbi:MAG TPA: histidine kinase, partial [Novosphingobium sp.]